MLKARMNYIPVWVIFFLLTPIIGETCSMYKITKDGKTIVGNNEDWLSPNSQFWFEKADVNKFGVMYMGQLDNFAQGAINDKGLVFDGFANPELAVKNTKGKAEIPISTVVVNIMETMSQVEEVKAYFEKINLSYLSSSQLVFVDKSGSYLIVEGDELILGEEEEKAFSNFYYSQIESEEEVELENFQKGMKFIKSTEGNPSLGYCGDVMNSLSSGNVFGTQYSTIYDLKDLKIRTYLFHDYSKYVELDLNEELKKGNHKVMIADLFHKESTGYQHYQKYNEQPVQFLKELVEDSKGSTQELIQMGFNSIINRMGYEWLLDKNNPKKAIEILEYGTAIMPTDANLFDSLGDAYYRDKNYFKSKMSYEKSLALNPDNENAKKYLAKIKLEGN